MRNNKRGPQGRRGRMSLEELRAHQAALTLQHNEARRARGLEQAEANLAESLRVASARRERKEAHKAAVAELVREGEAKREADKEFRESIDQPVDVAVKRAVEDVEGESELKNP